MKTTRCVGFLSLVLSMCLAFLCVGCAIREESQIEQTEQSEQTEQTGQTEQTEKRPLTDFSKEELEQFFADMGVDLPEQIVGKTEDGLLLTVQALEDNPYGYLKYTVLGDPFPAQTYKKMRDAMDQYYGIERWDEEDDSIDPDSPGAVTKYRLIFPENHVITAELIPNSFSEPYYALSKDQMSNGSIFYMESRIPFSDDLLEHPDHAEISWYMGTHSGVTDQWEISLNDGWVCYLYEGIFDTSVAWRSGDVGLVYGAMIGQPGEMFVFTLDWPNYYNTSEEFKLDLLEEGDPGYVSLEEIYSFVSGITVESYTEYP